MKTKSLSVLMLTYFTALLLSLTSIDTAFAKNSTATRCLNTHLKEAISVNLQRRDLYANLTQQQSLEISNLLIHNERLARIFAFHFDNWAYPFQKQGLPVLCDEVISMDQIPEFGTFGTSEQNVASLDNFKQPLKKDLKTSFRNAVSKRDWKNIELTGKSWLNQLNSQPEYNCMLRHVIETIIRAAQMAPRHLEKADSFHLDDEEVESLQELIRSFIKGLTYTFELALELDRMAAPLQAKGIPIICQDVPPIPIN